MRQTHSEAAAQRHLKRNTRIKRLENPKTPEREPYVIASNDVWKDVATL
jgi:hypothetical protein